MAPLPATPPASTAALPATSALVASSPMSLEQMTAAVNELTRSMADICSRLSNMAARRQWPMPPFLPYGMPGYGTTLLPFQDVQPTVLPFQDVQPTTLPFQGVQPVAPPLQGVQPSAPVQLTAPVPIHQAAVRLQAAARGLLARWRVRRLCNLQLIQPRTPSQFLQAVCRHAKAHTTTALQPTMLERQVSAVVWLQAAARGLLARRQVQEMRDLQLIQPCTPSQLLQVALRRVEDFDLVCCVGDLRHAVFPTGSGHGVFPADGVLQLGGSGGRAEVFLFVTGEDALPSASAFRYRPPRGRLRWSLLRLIPGGRSRAPLSFRWSPWNPSGYTRAGPARGGCPPYLSLKSSSIQVNLKNSTITGDI